MPQRWLVLAIILALDASATADTAVAPSLLTDRGFGPIQPAAKLTKTLLIAAFPDAKVVRRSWEGEGGDLVGFEILRNGTAIARAIPDEEIIFLGPQWRTDKGIAVGSTYEQLRQIYPRIRCVRELMSIDGGDGPNSCSAPAVALQFEVELHATLVDAPCKPRGPACCALDGPCNQAALAHAVLKQYSLKLRPPAQ